MPIRDMGYQPYKGELQSHKGRYWTIAWRLLAGAWAARSVKLALFGALFPMVIFVIPFLLCLLPPLILCFLSPPLLTLERTTTMPCFAL